MSHALSCTANFGSAGMGDVVATGARHDAQEVPPIAPTVSSTLGSGTVVPTGGSGLLVIRIAAVAVAQKEVVASRYS